MAQARLPVLRDPEVGGLDLRALLNRFGSPLFIVDSQRLDRQAATLTRMFPPPRYRLYYAVKANPRVAIVRHLMRHGFGCDASGIDDVDLALRAGCSPSAISVTGVGLSSAELEQLLARGVCLNLDSIDELRLCCELHPGGRVGLRINPRVAAGFHPHVIAGAHNGKLGIDLDDLPEALAVAREAGAAVQTLHAHIGSSINDPYPFIAACDVLLGLAARLPSVTTLNLGGGLGIPYEVETPIFPLERLERQLRVMIDAFAAATGRTLVLALEPGEYLVGPAGYLAATVRVTKPSSKIAILDASANLLPAVLLYGEPYETAVLPGRPRNGVEETWTICGRTNQGGDILATGRTRPLQRGDIVLFSTVGAYAACRASQFNQLPRPAEIIVDRNDVQVIQAAEDHADLMRHQDAARTGQHPRRADTVRLDTYRACSAQIDYAYAVDGERHELSIRFLDSATQIDDRERDLVTGTTGVLLAQLVLARRLEYETPLPTDLVTALRRCLQVLYDVRCFCDHRPLADAPEIAGGPPSVLSPKAADRTGAGTLVALSGGFDSTLLLHMASRHDARVEAVHFRVNDSVRDEEERAARAIADACKVRLHVVDIETPGLVDLGRRHSHSFGQFPRYNAVPHGRDLLLMPLAAIVARRRGLRRIAFGFDRESRFEQMIYRGRTIHRNDFASEYGFGLATALVREHLDPSLEFEAPLWSVSGYRIRRAVLDCLPQLAAEIQTCYWERWCGRCVKCVTTALLQADAVWSQVQFRNDMVDDPQNEYLTALLTPDRRVAGLPYWELATYTLDRLAGTGDNRFWVRRFVEGAHEHHPKDLHKARQLCNAIDRQALVARFGQVAEGLFDRP